MKLHKSYSKSGFTLIELSVVLIVLGLLTIAFLRLYSVHDKKIVGERTAHSITAAHNALKKYQNENGYFPCPADPTDPSGLATDCNLPPPPGIRVVAGTDGRLVRIGAMPVLDLGGVNKLILSSESKDGWNNRLTYAVTENMAKSASSFSSGQGGITIKDFKGDNLTTTANIVVLSHGEDGVGSYSAGGILTSACGAGSKDSENCNDDAVFLSSDRSFAMGVDYHDDYIEYAIEKSSGNICYPDVPDVIICPNAAGTHADRLYLYALTNASVTYFNGYAEAKQDKTLVFARTGARMLALNAFGNITGPCASGALSLDDHVNAGRAFWNIIHSKAACPTLVDPPPLTEPPVFEQDTGGNNFSDGGGGSDYGGTDSAGNATDSGSTGNVGGDVSGDGQGAY